ncbi:hypothetical protein GLOTRDRAFT_92542 [Gloeophyllum trabeum ATCC 11539]|uniref:Uncharacterized protein n=1 Tax=Gloeophyllum trabeum (strain ATCC 11539 / FP-39264 / Madison 617) TaxID=670483 RepID=S7QDT9_GLOTA|nr:uncharacterized protein GLOTRDRAFT_92542 [Gloeophyllum trabeum ATCC 11539]EPQ57537.1 hypothetical protein GLOTRDRAFT_92542 [Gloeophyllum trabeum ATCC 11539]
MFAVFNIMKRAYDADTPKTPSLHASPRENQGQVPTRPVDPVLLHNFLAETHQVEGCTCQFCGMRNEQARSSIDTQATEDTTHHAHVPNTSDADTTHTDTHSGPEPDAGTATHLTPGVQHIEDGSTTADEAVSPVNLDTAEPHFPYTGENVPLCSSAPVTPEEPHNDSPSIDANHTSRDRTSTRGRTTLGLGLIFPPGLSRTPGSSTPTPPAFPEFTTALPAQHPDIVPTPPPVSLNSPPPPAPNPENDHSSRIYSPDPQAYVHHGRRHPNFGEAAYPNPHFDPLSDAAHDLPIPSRRAPANADLYTHRRHPSSHRRRRHRSPSYDPAEPPPRYTQRDYRRAPLFARRDMDAYLDADPAAIAEDLPPYATHDPLLVRHYRHPPYIPGFRDDALMGGARSRSSSGSSEGGRGGLVASLARGAARLCAFVSSGREPAPRGYGVDRSDRVPLEVIRRELVQQEWQTMAMGFS